MTPYYQSLFDHIAQEHGLTLLESEMQQIIEKCRPYCCADLMAIIDEHERGDKMLLEMLGNPPTIAEGIATLKAV